MHITNDCISVFLQFLISLSYCNYNPSWTLSLACVCVCVCIYICIYTHFWDIIIKWPRGINEKSEVLIQRPKLPNLNCCIILLIEKLLLLTREGNGTPLQYSCLENPMEEEPGRLQSMRSLRVGHNWATSLSLFTFMHWRRTWQPTPVLLPGKSQGRGSLVGFRLWVAKSRTRTKRLSSSILLTLGNRP